jgi:hypothetical protein
MIPSLRLHTLRRSRRLEDSRSIRFCTHQFMMSEGGTVAVQKSHLEIRHAFPPLLWCSANTELPESFSFLQVCKGYSIELFIPDRLNKPKYSQDVFFLSEGGGCIVDSMLMLVVTHRSKLVSDPRCVECQEPQHKHRGSREGVGLMPQEGGDERGPGGEDGDGGRRGPRCLDDDRSWRASMERRQDGET